jgi:hypothetical protein
VLGKFGVFGVVDGGGATVIWDVELPLTTVKTHWSPAGSHLYGVTAPTLSVQVCPDGQEQQAYP